MGIYIFYTTMIERKKSVRMRLKIGKIQGSHISKKMRIFFFNENHDCEEDEDDRVVCIS
jgi:hypothetical protein